MKTIILKPSQKKIFRRLLTILIFITVFIVFVYLVIPPFNNKLITMLILLSVGILPSIILLIEYLGKTLNITSVEFTETDFTVLYKGDITVHFSYAELKVVELYKAAGMDKGNYSFNSNEQYYFANLIAKNGKSTTLTSLLGPDLSDGLDLIVAVPIERTKTGYAFIFSHRV